MSDTVFRLRNANDAPDPDVVATLESALDMARCGELRSVVIAGDLTGHRTFTTFSTNDLMREIATVAFLQHTLCARQFENKE